MMLTVRYLQKLEKKEKKPWVTWPKIFSVILDSFCCGNVPKFFRFFHGSDVVQLQDFRPSSINPNLSRVFFDSIKDFKLFPSSIKLQ